MTEKKWGLARLAFDAGLFTAVIVSAVYVISIDAAAGGPEVSQAPTDIPLQQTALPNLVTELVEGDRDPTDVASPEHDRESSGGTVYLTDPQFHP